MDEKARETRLQTLDRQREGGLNYQTPRTSCRASRRGSITCHLWSHPLKSDEGSRAA
jgi:hypothetical protein